LTRYKPTFNVQSGANDLTQDTIRVEVQRAITNRISTFTLVADDRNGKWSGLGWNDPIEIGIEDTRILDGRIDDPYREISKRDARIINLVGRGIEGALQDVISSLHLVNMTPQAIVGAIINEYAARKLADDPTIYIDSNLAPDTFNMSFLWRRKNLWDMLQDVADTLSAPPELGGDDKFYDFYVVPGSGGGFVFEPVGQRDSGVSIPLYTDEIKKRTYHIDSLPVKSDVWVWGNGSAGTLPLEMEPGYVAPGVRQDPWTENNADDYLKGDSVDLITNDNTEHVIGDWSIRITTLSIFGTGRFYWIMPFPFGGPYPPGGSKWPGQLPGYKLNCYNELGMAETMGELSAIGFFLKTDTPFNFLIEVVDEGDLRAQSEAIRVEKGVNWYAPTWNYVQLPFGSSSNYKTMSDTDVIDWSRIKEIRYCGFNFPYGLGTIQIAFDGLRFIKPLVVNVTGGYKATRRSHIQQATGIADYALAKVYALSLLENMKNPQQYFDFENVGRVDIPVGYKFTLEGAELVMREETFLFSKDEGWIIKGKGFEAT
jgi:hypothetical protein